ncbi:PREDICTED: probable ATP-dependent RNA helicase DDX56 [Amphimedon queenslandica]|uniref:RNA helicase n=1 Tax=Amphimedon queenslandica TaxID=400682 RepID=A0A1X7VMN9_AMPQE|nr:PREDICTED: probable ATP-dependent RNA helicase DDX56 [Amphimedon queenslandica]|eukprot:XP_019864377.1 PREDICTED: probable ATP-dependent RNA helicase DDX56 [Amphimedon queenslandica]
MSACGTMRFDEMNLDPRIVKAVRKLGWGQPTPIQEKAVPLIMEGKDLVVKAKTGSGKTASYALPLIQKILELQSTSIKVPPSVKALVLVPSQELSLQAAAQIKELCTCCSRDIKVVCVSQSNAVSSQRTVLLECPDVVVGTPSRILSHLSGKSLLLTESLHFVIFDEADLLFSYGYEEDINNIVSFLPSPIQSILMSATLNEDVISLKKVVLHQPVTIKLEESELPQDDRLTQYHIQCLEDDKFLLIYSLLKLKLIRGKSLIFVNDITRCYKLKLFLEQFFIKSCVLNSELPHNSRCHVIEQFNRDIYDYIIATDELVDHTHQTKKKKKGQDKEYGVSRGIDFQGVVNVVNFDFPPNSKAYIHRVGRTARGNDYGTALTFVSPSEETKLTELQLLLKEQRDFDHDLVQPYKFKMSEIEGFRYRVQEAVQAVTQLAIKEARLKEIRCEILSSKRLKTHFEDNPRDLQVLRHDRDLLPSSKVKEHLKYIPPYLVPKALKSSAVEEREGIGDGNMKRRRAHKVRQHNNPLKTFKLTNETKLVSKPSKKRKLEES